MITIIPTRRSWITGTRLALAVLLLALGGGGALLLDGWVAAAAGCVAAVA